MMFLNVLAESGAVGGATGQIAKRANGAKISAKAAKKARISKRTKTGKAIYKKVAGMQG